MKNFFKLLSQVGVILSAIILLAVMKKPFVLNSMNIGVKKIIYQMMYLYILIFL